MEQRAASGCAGSTGDCSSAIPSSSGCEPGRGGERGRFGEAGGIEGGSCPGARPGGQPPCEQVRILNPLIIMFRCFLTTPNSSTHTFVLGPWPWPRGLFTLSARLVDGAGAGRCRMPRGRVRSGLGRSTGAGRSWGPRSTAGAGFGILADPARGVRGATNFQPTELIYLRGVEGQNPALSFAARQ